MATAELLDDEEGIDKVLQQLPEDVLFSILNHLDASSLVASVKVCCKWCRQVKTIATMRLQEEDGDGESNLRRLRAGELLKERVGPRPSDRDWTHEWSTLIAEEVNSLGRTASLRAHCSSDTA